MSRVGREELLAHALTVPGAWRDEPWEGDVVAKAGEETFCFFGAPDRAPGVGVECGSRSEADEWLDEFPEGASVSGYIGRFGRNDLRAAGAIPDDELLGAITASHEQVAKLPRAQRPRHG